MRYQHSCSIMAAAAILVLAACSSMERRQAPEKADLPKSRQPADAVQATPPSASVDSRQVPDQPAVPEPGEAAKVTQATQTPASAYIPEPTGPSVPQIAQGSASVTYEMPDVATSPEQLKYLQAVMFERADGKRELRLFFSSESMGDLVVTDYFGAMDQGFADWVYVDTGDQMTWRTVVEVTVDPRQPTVGFHAQGYPAGTLASAEGSAFKTIAIDGDIVSGVIALNKPEASWSVAGPFRAPITVVRQVAPISGPAIAETPQGRRVVAYMKALKQRRLMAVKPHLTDEAYQSLRDGLQVVQNLGKNVAVDNKEVRQRFEKMRERGVANFWTGMRIDPVALRDAFSGGRARLFVAGKRGLLKLFEEANPAEVKRLIRFRWHDGQWLVD